jgi:hypothetical protein
MGQQNQVEAPGPHTHLCQFQVSLILAPSHCKSFVNRCYVLEERERGRDSILLHKNTVPVCTLYVISTTSRPIYRLITETIELNLNACNLNSGYITTKLVSCMP